MSTTSTSKNNNDQEQNLEVEENALGFRSLEHENDDEYELEWLLSSFVEHTRISRVKTKNRLTLIFTSLEFTDRGNYRCSAKLKKAPSSNSNLQKQSLVKSTTLNVLLPDGECAPNFFKCRSGSCIASKYECDGYADCPDQDDESLELCGPNPCLNKLRCSDNRCMDAALCCNPAMDRNCTVIPECCKTLLEINRRFFQMGIKHSKEIASAGKTNFASTIYTVVGYTAAFVAVLVFIILAVCRLHAKEVFVRRNVRASGTLVNPRGSNREHPPITLHDLDIYFNSLRQTESNPSLAQGGVTYNINNGVQFVGRPVQPPAYSAVVQDPGIIDGPPPPYSAAPPPGSQTGGGGEMESTRRSSRRHHHHHRRRRQHGHSSERTEEERQFISRVASLAAEMEQQGNNNNGDINGNSEMVNRQVEHQRQLDAAAAAAALAAGGATGRRQAAAAPRTPQIAAAASNHHSRHNLQDSSSDSSD